MSDQMYLFTMTDQYGVLIGRWRTSQVRHVRGQVTSRIPANLMGPGVFHVDWEKAGTLKWEDE